jgi:hypothetical protein
VNYFLEKNFMAMTTTKQEFLNGLRARNDKVRQLVQTDFLPLSQAARSSQPAPNEWCVDQCFQHLVLAFEMFLPQAVKKLEKGKGAESDGVFIPSWLASRNFYRQLYSPSMKVKTRPAVMPSEYYYPDVFDQFLTQKEHLSAMLDDAVNADLRTRCYFFYVFPVNLGDYLEQFVMHDELHIDQAQRALAAYHQIKKGTVA